MEGDRHLKTYAYKMIFTVASHRKDVKMLADSKILFSKCGKRWMSFSNSEIHWRWEWRRGLEYDKFICCFSRPAFWSLKKLSGALKKVNCLHLSYLMFDVVYKLEQKFIQWKNDSFFGKKTASEMNQMLPEKGNQTKLDFLHFFPRTITYLESNLNFTIEICLCLKTTFPEKERLNLQWHPVCFHLRHRQPLWWVYRCKGPDWQTARLPKEAYR